MKQFSFLRWAFVCSLLFLPYVSRATPTCSTTTLDNIVGSTCTIGDKTLTFTTASITGINSALIEFTPDTSNPLSPGFELSLVTGVVLPSETRLLN
jgi:hypothetical protein